jgi:hypothetical protein
MENIVVLAPIPSASVAIAASVNAGLRRSPRPATIRSEIMGLSVLFSNCMTFSGHVYNRT